MTVIIILAPRLFILSLVFQTPTRQTPSPIFSQPRRGIRHTVTLSINRKVSELLHWNFTHTVLIIMVWDRKCPTSLRVYIIGYTSIKPVVIHDIVTKYSWYRYKREGWGYFCSKTP